MKKTQIKLGINRCAEQLTSVVSWAEILLEISAVDSHQPSCLSQRSVIRPTPTVSAVTVAGNNVRSFAVFTEDGLITPDD